MNKNEFLFWVKRLGAPVLTAVLGVILICNPDSASTLVVRILGWVLVLSGGAILAAAMLGHPQSRNTRMAIGIAMAAFGLWLLLNPLRFAKFIGRVLGLFLMIQAARDINLNLRYHGGKLEVSRSLILAIVTAVIGAVLIVLPLTTSRLLFTIIGAVMIGLGVGELLDRLKGRPRLDSGDPDVIDVEKL